MIHQHTWYILRWLRIVQMKIRSDGKSLNHFSNMVLSWNRSSNYIEITKTISYQVSAKALLVLNILSCFGDLYKSMHNDLNKTLFWPILFYIDESVCNKLTVKCMKNTLWIYRNDHVTSPGEPPNQYHAIAKFHHALCGSITIYVKFVQRFHSSCKQKQNPFFNSSSLFK